MMKVVFLDIDGVLNGHEWSKEARSCTIRSQCVRQLNRIIRRTECKFVISSAWRYMLLDNGEYRASMMFSGFQYMMRTHGVSVLFDVIGTTGSDEHFGYQKRTRGDGMRAEQIRAWLKANRQRVRYVVLDDEDDGFSKARMPFVRTNGKRGLSKRNADEAIHILNRGAIKDGR